MSSAIINIEGIDSMRKGRGRFRGDNRGLSLVELMCSVAIFVCITIVVGSVLVVTAKTYQGGTIEASLQEEAQLTVNVIEGLIVDATDAVNYYYTDLGGVEHNILSESSATPGTDRRLQILNNGSAVEYNIIYDASEKQLRYAKSGVATDYLLADNVESFGVDVSDFNYSHNVILDIKMKKDTKEFNSRYNVTTRNEKVVTSGPAAKWANVSVMPSELIVEPWEDLGLDVSITTSVGVSDTFDCSLINNSSPSTFAIANNDTDKVSLHIDGNEFGSASNNDMRLRVYTVETEDDGYTCLGQRFVPICVRRVEGISVVMTKDSPFMGAYAAGTTYTVNSTISGTPYLDRKPMESVANYKNPYYVRWDYVFSYGGVTIATGDPNNAVLSTYFDIQEYEDTDNPRPYVKIKLNQNMPYECSLKVIGTAKHSDGENRTGIAYASIKDNALLTRTSNVLSEPVTSLFKRGDDYLFGEILDNSILNNNNHGDGGAQYTWFWRYREMYDNGTYGAWSEYRMTKEGGNEKKINAEETMCLAPDKAYELEYISAVVNKNTKVMYYPYDSDLLAAGSGTGFESFSKGWTSTTEMDPAEYASRYQIGRARMKFNTTNAEWGVTAGDRTIGSQASPVRLDKNDWFEVTMEADCLSYGDFNGKFTWYMEKLEGGVWVPATKNGFDCDDRTKLLIKGIQDTTPSATYRFKSYIDDYVLKEMAGDVMNPQYTDVSIQDYDMYNEATDEGMVYIQIN